MELPLAAAANEVFTGGVTTTTGLKAQLNGVTPTDEEFKTAFETARVSKAQLARYYLRSLEMAARNESEPWFLPTQDPSVINLEHILPKKPQGNWPQFTDDEASIYVNRLGNQALLQASTNSNLGSVGFVDKKTVLKASKYVLTSQIADRADWRTTEIAERQNGLAALAPTAWPI